VGLFLFDLGLLSNFKSVRSIKEFHNFLNSFKKSVSPFSSGPFLVSRTGNEGFNLTLSS